MRGWPGHTDPGETFILKIDPKNGGPSISSFLRQTSPSVGIHKHRHPNSDEILFLQNGDSVREVHAGSTVYIPAGTWISLSNTGKDGISLVSVFSARGFEDFMRAGSVREGEKNVPMSEAENNQIEKSHSGDVTYKEP